MGSMGNYQNLLATKDINYTIAKADSLNALIVGPNRHGGKGACLSSGELIEALH